MPPKTTQTTTEGRMAKKTKKKKTKKKLAKKRKTPRKPPEAEKLKKKKPLDSVTKEILIAGAMANPGTVVSIGRLFVRSASPIEFGGIESERTIVAGVMLDDLKGHEEDELWEGTFIFVPRKRHKGFTYRPGGTIDDALLDGYGLDPTHFREEIPPPPSVSPDLF